MDTIQHLKLQTCRTKIQVNLPLFVYPILTHDLLSTPMNKKKITFPSSITFQSFKLGSFFPLSKVQRKRKTLSDNQARHRLFFLNSCPVMCERVWYLVNRPKKENFNQLSNKFTVIKKFLHTQPQRIKETTSHQILVELRIYIRQPKIGHYTCSKTPRLISST